MNNKTRHFFAAFAVTGILIGACCGFAAVDLSTDRYMPEQFGTFFEVTEINAESIEFSFLAKHYLVDTAPPENIRALVKKYRGLLPLFPQIFSHIAADGTSVALEHLKAFA